MKIAVTEKARRHASYKSREKLGNRLTEGISVRITWKTMRAVANERLVHSGSCVAA